ncbi:MAG: hypothetical protein IKP36_10355 [Bacteroidaceae bacterium]|nr:hypothetical protein [Bacteroidaceae bacterium]
MKARTIFAALLLIAAVSQTVRAQKVLIYKTDKTLVELKTSEVDSMVFVPEEPLLTCPDDNHPHAIDLGLPSGTKWACCNVGASTPEGYGGYYAWGETYEKNTYTWENYKFCPTGSWCQLTKYCNNPDYGYDYGYYGGGSSRYVDNLTELEPDDDAATVNMGAPWRMPSYEQQEELMDNCSHMSIEQNGVIGVLFKGTNGGQIFLPAAGFASSENHIHVGLAPYYWSRSLQLIVGLCDSALRLPGFNGHSAYRGEGLSVRAVCP